MRLKISSCLPKKSIYFKVTEEDRIETAKLSEQQKNKRAIKIKKRIPKQTHNGQIAETFKPLTEKLSKTTEAIEKLSSSHETHQELVLAQDKQENKTENIESNPRTLPKFYV